MASGPTIDQFQDVILRLVRQGSENNLWVRQTVRITAPPVVVEIIRNELECRG